VILAEGGTEGGKIFVELGMSLGVFFLILIPAAIGRASLERKRPPSR
jgi:hypothetical protein